MDLAYNYVNPSLFLLFLCIINIILWRFINQARESIRTKDEEHQEESRESFSSVRHSPWSVDNMKFNTKTLKKCNFSSQKLYLIWDNGTLNSSMGLHAKEMFNSKKIYNLIFFIIWRASLVFDHFNSLFEIQHFSGAEHLIGLRQDCLLRSTWEKTNRALYLFRFNHGCQTKFENHFFKG